MRATIRPIVTEDAEALREVLNAVAQERFYLLTLEAPPLEAVKSFVANNIDKGYPQLIAEYEGQIIGWADFVPYEKSVLMHSAHLGMGVAKAFRGEGIGDALLTAITEAAIAKGYTRLELEVFANNTAAITLYEKHGFVEEGIKRNARCIDNTYFHVKLMAYFPS